MFFYIVGCIVHYLRKRALTKICKVIRMDKFNYFSQDTGWFIRISTGFIDEFSKNKHQLNGFSGNILTKTHIAW